MDNERRPVVVGFNGITYDARRATPWGTTGGPIVPKAYRVLHGEQEAPILLKNQVEDPSLTLGDLGRSIWRRVQLQGQSQKLRRALASELVRLQVPGRALAIPAGLPMSWVADLPLRTRTRNAISRFIVEHGDGPLEHSLSNEDVMRWKAVGANTLIDLLCVLESAEVDWPAKQSVGSRVADPAPTESAAPGNEPANCSTTSLPSHATSELANPACEYLMDVAAWALSETRAETIGDALAHLVGKVSSLEEWRRLAQIRLLEISDYAAHPYRAIQDWVSRLPERERLIFVDRFRVVDERPTLQEVGNRVKLTRERVRQLERLLLDQLAEHMETRRGRAIKWRVDTLRQRVGVAVPLDQVTALLAAPTPTWDYSFLLKLLAGPYVEHEDWLVLKPALGDDPTPTLLGQTDEIGCILMEEARETLRVWGLHPALHVAWLTRRDRCRLIDGRLVRWKGPLGGKLAFTLDRLGSPATVSEIKDNLSLEQSPGSIQNALREDTRFVRCSGTEWGLAWWGLPEYSGTASTIRRLLKRRGPMPVEEVVEWMSETFDSHRRTVTTYCYIPAFVVEDGMIRIREPDEPFIHSLAPVRDAKGVFSLGPRQVALLLEVDSNLLRGSGRPLGPVAGRLLGIAPDDQLEFRSAQGHMVRVTFPSTAINGPALGTVRVVASALGAKKGDLITLVLDSREGTLAAMVTDPAVHRASWPLLSRLTGIDQESGYDGLASALECEPGEVRSVLLGRGDHAVVNALPH